MNYLLFALIPLITSGLSAYFGSYLKKKGENLATHEDIKRLVDQVRAVTETTEQIKAQISDEVWDRQKRWELKREVCFGAAKRLADLGDALLSIYSLLALEHKNHTQGKTLGYPKEKAERATRWRRVSTAFSQTRLLVTITCGEGARDAIEEYEILTNTVSTGMFNDDSCDTYKKSKLELLKKAYDVRIAIRKELGTDAAPASIQCIFGSPAPDPPSPKAM